MVPFAAATGVIVVIAARSAVLDFGWPQLRRSCTVSSPGAWSGARCCATERVCLFDSFIFVCFRIDNSYISDSLNR